MMGKFEFKTTNASEEEVEDAKRTAEELLRQPLPLSHALPALAFLGYRDEETGKVLLCKEIRVYETIKQGNRDTYRTGYDRIFVMPRKTNKVSENTARKTEDDRIHVAVESFTSEEVDRLYQKMKEEMERKLQAERERVKAETTWKK